MCLCLKDLGYVTNVILLNLLLSSYCSAVFSLPDAKMLSFFGIVPPGHILDIPNGILGMTFYAYIFVMYTASPSQSLSSIQILFHPSTNMMITSLAMASSLFLGRKLYEITKICVVCLTTHAINTTLFVRSAREINARGKKGKKNSIRVQQLVSIVVRT